MKEVQAKFSPYPYEEGSFLFANFTHLEGYSSMYYTYMWSLTLAKDLFTRFARRADGRGRGRRLREVRHRRRRRGGRGEDGRELPRPPSSFDAFEKYLKE